MQRFQLAEHADSLLPDGHRFELVWHDEFDGDTLDESKWDYRTCMMGKEHPAWTRDGIHLDGQSHVVFTCHEHEGRIVSPQLQTGYNFMDQPVVTTTFCNDHLQWNIGKLHENKFTKKYGYFECRCRLQQTSGWWSAFWMQSPMIGASLNAADSGTELDIMECFKPGDIIAHNAFTGGYGLDMKRASVGGKKGLDVVQWHTFGMLWTPESYTFYIDGEEDGVITEHISHIPEFILISTEVKGYRHANHQFVEEARLSVGDTFLVDHVRVFDMVE